VNTEQELPEVLRLHNTFADAKYGLREEWLVAAVAAIKTALFDPRELWLPPVIRISTGPCPGKAIAMCVDEECATDGSCNIFVSPMIDDPLVVIAAVTHELCHACVGNEAKHGGVFIKVFREIGFECKATQANVIEGSEIHATLCGILIELGPYPHKQLVKKEKQKKAHKWISYKSISNEDYVIRANYFTCQELGNPRDFNGDPMEPSDPEKVQELEDQAEAEAALLLESVEPSVRAQFEIVPESPFPEEN
jgi:hypothetical protein